MEVKLTSGVTSRTEKPVPPVDMTTSECMIFTTTQTSADSISGRPYISRF